MSSYGCESSDLTPKLSRGRSFGLTFCSLCLIVAGTAGACAGIQRLSSNILILGLQDYLFFCEGIGLLLAGFGLLLHRNWGRRLVLVLIVLSLLTRGMIGCRALWSIDGWPGFVLPCVILALPLALFRFIHRSERWMRRDCITQIKPRLVAGTAVALLSILLVRVVNLPGRERSDDLPKVSHGELDFLLHHEKCELNELVLVGSHGRDSLSKEVPLGHLELVPSDRKVRVVGLPPFGKADVIVDLDRNTLTVNGSTFVGRPHSTERLVFQNRPGKGVIFERKLGPIHGTISIHRQPDDSLLILLNELYLHGSRLTEFFIATPLK